MADDFESIAADIARAVDAEERGALWPGEPLYRRTLAGGEDFVAYPYETPRGLGRHFDYRVLARVGRRYAEVLVTREMLTDGALALRVVVESLRQKLARPPLD